MRLRRPKRRTLVVAGVLFGLVAVLFLFRSSPLKRFYFLVEAGTDYDDVIKLLGRPANSRSVAGRVWHDTGFTAGSAVPPWANHNQQLVDQKYPVKEYQVHSWTRDLWFSSEFFIVIVDDGNVVCRQQSGDAVGYWGRFKTAIASLF